MRSSVSWEGTGGGSRGRSLGEAETEALEAKRSGFEPWPCLPLHDFVARKVTSDSSPLISYQICHFYFYSPFLKLYFPSSLSVPPAFH